MFDSGSFLRRRKRFKRSFNDTVEGSFCHFYPYNRFSAVKRWDKMDEKKMMMMMMMFMTSRKEDKMLPSTSCFRSQKVPAFGRFWPKHPGMTHQKLLLSGMVERWNKRSSKEDG